MSDNIYFYPIYIILTQWAFPFIYVSLYVEGEDPETTHTPHKFAGMLTQCKLSHSCSSVSLSLLLYVQRRGPRFWLRIEMMSHINNDLNRSV